MKKCLLLSFLFCSLISYGQDSLKQFYWKSASELIFSFGDVKATSGPTSNEEINIDPVVRFSAFFHLQEQIHYDFNKNVGVFSGLGIRNVGFINKLNDSITLKQRVYSLGIPVAIKVGNLRKDFYVALGAEFELFFHYKQKVIYDDDKRKNTEWFSDRVNLFNPSAFIDIKFPRDTYLRFKYYFTDFLVADKQSVKVDSVPYGYYPSESQLFYVAIGATIKHKKRVKTGSGKSSSGTSTMLY